jgi:hypothetical protein
VIPQADAANASEFAAYGVLYALRHGAKALGPELTALPEQLLATPALVHALATCRAVRWAGRGAGRGGGGHW